MNRFIKSVTILLISLMIVFCSDKGTKSKKNVTLNSELKYILGLYLKEIDNLEPDKFNLNVIVSEMEDKNTRLWISNEFIDRHVYNPALYPSKYDNFNVYIYDSLCTFIDTTSFKITTVNNHSKDDVVPLTYNAASWEIIYNNKLEVVKVYYQFCDIEQDIDSLLVNRE